LPPVVAFRHKFDLGLFDNPSSATVSPTARTAGRFLARQARSPVADLLDDETHSADRGRCGDRGGQAGGGRPRLLEGDITAQPTSRSSWAIRR
jgi:hypothetical protein